MHGRLGFAAVSSRRARGLFAGALILAAIHMSNGAAVAEGAMAVGSSGNLAKDGFAFGAAINEASREEAIAQALKTCRSYQGAPNMAKICRLVATFKSECYALAYDPKAGMPGTGWAIATDEETAKERALGTCRATAGNRSEFCKVDQSGCDTR